MVLISEKSTGQGLSEEGTMEGSEEKAVAWSVGLPADSGLAAITEHASTKGPFIYLISVHPASEFCAIFSSNLSERGMLASVCTLDPYGNCSGFAPHHATYRPNTSIQHTMYEQDG